MIKKVLKVIGVSVIFLVGAVQAAPFETSNDVMNQMTNDDNKPLVIFVKSYADSYSERQAAFIRTYGQNIIAINKNLVQVQDEIVKKYNVKDEDGDDSGDKIVDNKDFNSSREAYDLNKIITEKKKTKNDLIIQYFKKEVQTYKDFITKLDDIDVNPKTKLGFKNNIQPLTKIFVNDIPQNISISIRKEDEMMKDQNPIVTLRMQKLLDISYVSMLDKMNQSLDLAMTNALLKSLAATPKVHKDPIK
jgi:hypothetical protein